MGDRYAELAKETAGWSIGGDWLYAFSAFLVE